MSMPPGEGEEDTGQHELVIIRRRGGGEEAAHKGGVWKIAHADFMTALMAFFLVMWLINATDDKTVTGVANYFNPVRLTDQAAQPKGIFTIDPGSEHQGGKPGKEKADKHSGSKSDKGAEKAKSAEVALLSNPYQELDTIAAQAHAEVPGGEKDGNAAHGDPQAFRDPFDPDARFLSANPGDSHVAAGGKGQLGSGAGNGEGEASQEHPEIAPGIDGRDGKGNGSEAALRQPIEEVIKQSGFDPIPGIEVTSTEQGLLISITDQPDFEMFGVSSVRPKAELVVLMEKIGKVLVDRPEHIVIRGHTDARPYKAGGYDNWRLSAARAQMAYYMLVRGGIPDGRFDRIEGHADHDLKNSQRPLAAENRRIEILLLKDKS